MTLPRIFAVVPAAGFSRRMGRPKLLLPLGGRAVIARVLEALRGGGVDATYVLARADDVGLQRELDGSGVHTVLADDATEDMRASAELLLSRIREEQHPLRNDAWLLAPADYPVLNPSVVSRLIASWRADPAGIVVPACGGRSGHPTLFGWPFAERVACIPAGEGLNRLLRDGAGQVRQVDFESPEILQDLDTPADYERLKLIAGDD
jgi:molybdenum cofactor cytidylyltransferase